MKRCTRCAQLKSLEDFPRDKRAKDGRASRCNACMSEVLAAYKATPEGREARLASQRKYQASQEGHMARTVYARTDKSRAQRRAYAHTETGKKVMRKSRADYVKRLRMTREGRLKLQAGMAVRHAIERGEIPPVYSLSCKTCGIQAEHYHHYLGYSRPHWFHIMPLCHGCHHQVHHPPAS